MTAPKVSIIMPTYNQARFIKEAIQSVVEQTFPQWELVIVDDGSNDDTGAIVAQFDDLRIRYIYQANRGASEARNVGIAASTGEYVAFLDADDLYCPQKLAVQVAHLDQNPDIGITYSSRIEIDQHGNRVNLAHLPGKATLESVVLGFPFAPTDFMVRRLWLQSSGGFRRGFVVNEDRDLYIRLVLAGCICVNTEQFLAYRRLNTQKTFRDLPARLDDMVRALDTAFSDARCPAEVHLLYKLAHCNIYLDWAYQAAIQGETDLAQAYFRQVLHYDPAILRDKARKLLRSLIYTATRDGGDYASRLRQLFTQLPLEMATVVQETDWTLAHAAFLSGLNHILWGRVDEGRVHLAQAVKRQVQLDKLILQDATEQLLSYESLFGVAATQIVLQNLVSSLKESGITAGARWLYSCYSINLAFRCYQKQQYRHVPSIVLGALVQNPIYLLNRGVMSILARSTIQALRPSTT